MGFYGNITNTSRTQFVFDRIYPNRWIMDKACTTDGVYAGRYVLVEYETDFSKDIFKEGYYLIDGEVYSAINTHSDGLFCGPVATMKILASSMEEEDVLLIAANNQYSDLNTTPLYVRITSADGSSFEFVDYNTYVNYWTSTTGNQPPSSTDTEAIHLHIANGKIVNFNTNTMKVDNIFCVQTGCMYNTGDTEKYLEAVSVDGVLEWQEIGSDIHSNYFANSNFDRINYGSSRGYDSTVWQKVYTNNEEKYVMIAELNTVVPTFDIVADAPTLNPIAPHFDTDSTNIYYKFHWQPQWGLRTKAASNSLVGSTISTTGEIDAGKLVSMTADTIFYPSDQKTTWKGKFYNSLDDSETNKYYNPITATWQEDARTFDAAIYFNKAGFDPKEVVYSEDLFDPKKNSYNSNIANGGWTKEDKIDLSPTGRSGNVYNQHNHNSDMTAQVDTQELSVMLPSLGDTIAEMWDLVYGGRDTNEEIKTSSKRNLDIQWENAADIIKREGLRLVNEKENGNGYELTEQESDTIAGAINSVHDLMGMIIVDNAENLVTEDNIANLSEDCIYYNSTNGTFNRKQEVYNYNEVEYSYQENEDVQEDTYYPNFFYTDLNGTIDTSETYTAGQTYYEKILSSDTVQNLYQEIELDSWDLSAEYYTKTLAGEYKKETSTTPSTGRTYLFCDEESLKPLEITFSTDYTPNSLYYLDNNNFILSTDENVDSGKIYYSIDESKITQITKYPTSASVSDAKMLYSPNQFYYKRDDGVYIKISLSHDEAKQYFTGVSEGTTDKYLQIPGEAEGTYYPVYVLDFDKSTASSEIIGYAEDGKGNIVPVVNTNNIQINWVCEVKVYEFDTAKEYYYIDTTNSSNPPSRYVRITYETYPNLLFGVNLYEFEQGAYTVQDAFYAPNTFWYKANNGSYLIDKNSNITNGRIYYRNITDDNFTIAGSNFYIPNKYYILEDNSYVLSKSLTKDDTITYYTLNDLYVLEDSFGIYPTGSEWLTLSSVIPATVKLGTRTSSYELVELTGFARSLNTIHGLILKINQFLEFGNSETRDRNTVQGALNTLNDYINKFKCLNANQFVVTDSYGRLESAQFSTKQDVYAISWQNSFSPPEDYFTIDGEEDAFINLDLSTNPLESNFKLTHNTHSIVEDIPVYSDKNTVLSNATFDGILGNNNIDNDELMLLTPILDNVGHVIGKTVEHITLPYGFNKFTASNNSTNTSGLEVIEGPQIINAENTKDGIFLAASNKWLIYKVSGKELQLGHALSGVSAGEYVGSMNEDKAVYNIPNITIDAAGHITAVGTTALNIPKGFSKIFIGSNTTPSIEARIISQGLRVKTDSSLIVSTTTEEGSNPDSLIINHRTVNEENTANLYGETTEKVLNFGDSFNVLNIGVDNYGHTTQISATSLTLPTLPIIYEEGDILTFAYDATNTLQMYRTNLPDLVFNGLTIESNFNSTLIEATDSVNIAVNKLNQYMDNTNNTVSKLNQNMDNTINKDTVLYYRDSEDDTIQTISILSLLELLSNSVGAASSYSFENPDEE